MADRLTRLLSIKENLDNIGFHTKLMPVDGIDSYIIADGFGWLYFLNDEDSEYAQKHGDDIGKWMWFFNDLSQASYNCSLAVATNVVTQAKCTYPLIRDGVCCLYCGFLDFDRHIKILQFMMDNNLIRKTKTGKLYNISFKLDSDTRKKRYGKAFNPLLKLKYFINLDTGKFHKEVLDYKQFSYESWYKIVTANPRMFRFVPLAYRDIQMSIAATKTYIKKDGIYNFMFSTDSDESVWMSHQEVDEFLSLIPKDSFTLEVYSSIFEALEGNNMDDLILKYVTP